MTCQIKYIFSFIKSLIIVMERAWVIQLPLPAPPDLHTATQALLWPIALFPEGWPDRVWLLPFSRCLIQSLFIGFLRILPNLNLRGTPIFRTMSPVWTEWSEIDLWRKRTHAKSLQTLEKFFISAPCGRWMTKMTSVFHISCGHILCSETLDLLPSTGGSGMEQTNGAKT